MTYNNVVASDSVLTQSLDSPNQVYLQREPPPQAISPVGSPPRSRYEAALSPIASPVPASPLASSPMWGGSSLWGSVPQEKSTWNTEVPSRSRALSFDANADWDSVQVQFEPNVINAKPSSTSPGYPFFVSYPLLLTALPSSFDEDYSKDGVELDLGELLYEMDMSVKPFLPPDPDHPISPSLHLQPVPTSSQQIVQSHINDRMSRKSSAYSPGKTSMKSGNRYAFWSRPRPAT